MTDAQVLLATLAALALAVALFAAWRERRRRARHDPDAVGLLDWTTVQMGALLALMVLAGLAFRI